MITEAFLTDILWRLVIGAAFTLAIVRIIGERSIRQMTPLRIWAILVLVCMAIGLVV